MFNLLQKKGKALSGYSILSRSRVLILLSTNGIFYDINFYLSLTYVNNVARKIPFRLSSPQRTDCPYAV